MNRQEAERTVQKPILDVTCGSRSIWFNKRHPKALFCDKRKTSLTGVWKSSDQSLEIEPDIQCDFTDLPFTDNSFALVVFDPPHLTGAKETSWLVKKYGKAGSELAADAA